MPEAIPVMRVALGLLGLNLHPFLYSAEVPASEDTTRRIMSWARSIGFDAIEMEDRWIDFYLQPDSQIEDLGSLLESLEMPVASFKVRHKSLCHPAVRNDNENKLLRAVDIAQLLNSQTISISLAASPDVYGKEEVKLLGSKAPPGCSRDASSEDFERTARALGAAGEMAAKRGITIAVEIHPYSIADTSHSTLQLLDAIGLANVRANPDLGNILWAYDVPAEPWDAALERLASRSATWHCKNLHRIHLPEIERSVFFPRSLAEGDIDYRYAIAAMHEAGYEGYLIIEGGHTGDVLTQSSMNLEYVNSILSELR